jgi:hypothetical protein
MDGELDPRTPDAESDPNDEETQPVEPVSSDDADGGGDHEISDEDLDSVSGGLF